ELGTRNGAHADRGGVREHVERPRPGAVAAEYAESVNGVAEDPEVAHTVGEDAHPSRIPSEEAHAPGRVAVQPAQAHDVRCPDRVAIHDDERAHAVTIQVLHLDPRQVYRVELCAHAVEDDGYGLVDR